MNTINFIIEGFYKHWHDRVSISGFWIPQFSAILLFDINLNMSLIISILGGVGAVVGIIRHSISAYREYILLKIDKKKLEGESEKVNQIE